MRSRWLWRALAILAVLVAVGLGAILIARPAADHEFFAQFEQQPLVMAHRGGKGLWPENTLYAFERAVVMGVDVLEMDIHSTADGVLVVMHDDTVDRTTEGTGPIHGMNLQELKKLDAGYEWSPDEGLTYPFRGLGIAVPVLEEVFSAFPQVPMNIEIKQAEPSIAKSLCQLIQAMGMTDRVLVASFHEEATREFRQACPQVASTAYQNEVVTLFALSKVGLAAAFSASPEAVQVPEYRGGLHVLTRRLIAAAHNRNLYVHAWTINDTEDMRRLIDLGIDGLITDYPDRLLALLGR